MESRCEGRDCWEHRTDNEHVGDISNWQKPTAATAAADNCGAQCRPLINFLVRRPAGNWWQPGYRDSGTNIDHRSGAEEPRSSTEGIRKDRMKKPNQLLPCPDSDVCVRRLPCRGLPGNRSQHRPAEVTSREPSAGAAARGRAEARAARGGRACVTRHSPRTAAARSHYQQIITNQHTAL